MDKGNQSYQKFLGGDKQGLVEIMALYSDSLVSFINGFVHDYGIATVCGEWDDELMASVGGNWIIDKDGNKISAEYDKIIRNDNETYTAYFDGYTQTHTLDKYGKVIE